VPEKKERRFWRVTESEFHNGNCLDAPRLFSYEWQTKGLRGQDSPDGDREGFVCRLEGLKVARIGRRRPLIGRKEWHRRGKGDQSGESLIGKHNEG